MTRKDAIEWMQTIKRGNYLDGIIDIPSDESTAFDMAIKALKQQDKILQILDDCELEAWEILEMIKEVVRE